MKLYTRSGDDGTTGLFSGARVSKNHPRIEAYGTVDELNACIGLAIAGIDGTDDAAAMLLSSLVSIQSRCFDLGADLATPEGGDVLTYSSPTNTWINEKATRLVDGGNF